MPAVWRTSACAALTLLALGSAPAARAQEVTGLQAAAAIESAMADAIAHAEKSIVAIARVKRGDRDDVGPLELRADPFGRLQMATSQPEPGDPNFIPNEYGTGVIVDRRGLILTHYHVLGEDSDYYITTPDRKVFSAKVHGADPRSDLAVLSIPASDLTPIKFGDASKLRKGQIVLALGNPYSIARDGQASASWGIIANLSRKAGPVPDETSTTGRSTLHHFGTLIQTDAKLNLGTSGGALLNLKGEMIGLTTSLAAAVGYEQSAGYAIPVDETFRRVLELLKQGREVEYGFLGVAPGNLDRGDILNGKHGMRVANVVEGTPAHRYGVQAGDIITHVNGQPVYDADGLILQVGRMAADAVVRLSIERDGRITPLTIELTKYWVPGKKIVTTPAPSWRGMRVDYATAVAEFPMRVLRGDIDLDGCVLVREVDKDSPAWKEGVRPDMFISHVGNTRIASPKEFHSAVAGKTGAVQLRQYSPEHNRVIRTIVRTVPATAG